MTRGIPFVVFILTGAALALSVPTWCTAACFEDSEAEGLFPLGPMREKALRWDRFLLETLVRKEAGVQLEGYRREEGIPLRFMLSQEDSGAPSSNAQQKLKQSGLAGYVQSHPCGLLVQAFVKDLRNGNLSEWLEPDWVLEFNKKGKVIRRWDVPLNAPMRAVQGEEVWVEWDPQPLCSGQGLDLRIYLVIRDDGGLRPVVRPGLISGRQKIKCPRSQDIPESDFLVCESMRDLKTRKSRRMAYQLPCR